MDPDMQFYSDSHYIQNLNCDYYFEKNFVDKIIESGTGKKQLSFFHLNVKSLPKHLDELEIFLESLEYEFSFIGLTETWLDENKHELYDLPGYNCINKYRLGRRGGGVSMCVKTGIPYNCRNDLEFFYCEMESIFIEIDSTVFNTKTNIIIGVIYRMPDASVDVFNERLSDTLNVVTKEKKICYLIGDLNIDLLKHEEHRPTSDFIDILYANNMFPLIVKPTRVTDKSATLIDHVLTNNFDVNSRHIQGILISSISDHYAIFHISGNIKLEASADIGMALKRDMRHHNIQNYLREMKTIDWSKVMECNEAQPAYSSFHAIISEKYNKCFPLRKCRTNRYNNSKPWLSSALKESIKYKNKLFINRNMGEDADERLTFYKLYRNKLNHILRITERNYYRDLLVEHKADVKKCWQVIKLIINKRKCKPICKEFKCNGTTIKDGQIIANKFNNFFINVGSSLSKNITQSNKSPSEHEFPNITENFVLDPVTENEIMKIISNFKDSSAGWDEMKPFIIKSIKESIKTPLAHICNTSFITGVFPYELKIANI